jgi:mono/diheme cytochrome c family protein
MLNARPPANFHEKQPSTLRAIDVLHNGVLGTAMVGMDQNMSPAQRDAVAAYVQSLFDQPPEASPR